MSLTHSDAVAEARSNPGETLCKARENRGLSLSDAATQLNLSISALSCLETGAFERLPGHTFARGYIRAYAKLLGLDQNRLVLEFDQFTGTDATGSAVHSIGRVEQTVKFSNSFLRWLVFALVAVAFVSGILWWQDQNALRQPSADTLVIEHVEVEGADGTTQIHPLDEPEDQAVELATDDLSSDLVPALVETPSQLPASDPVAPTDETVAVADASPVIASTEAPAVVEAAPAAPVAQMTPPLTQVPEAVPALAAGEGLVGINFTATCWMQLTDGNGKVLLSTLKRAGETLALAVKTPAELRLGYAPGAQVSFNGQSIDLAPFTSGETARLKLGQ